MTDPMNIHLLDQLDAVLRDVAPLLGKYRRQLFSSGFSREESFAMARDLQTIWFGSLGKTGGKD